MRDAQPPKPSLLLVDDDEVILEALGAFFAKRGYAIRKATSVAAVRHGVDLPTTDLAVVDYQLPDGDGLEVLRTLRALDATLPVVVLTAHASIDLAVQAIKEGADQFLTKPVDLPTLAIVLERLVEQRRNRQASLAQRSRSSRKALDPFLGASEAIRRLADQARRVVDSGVTVLLIGETGVGKGVLARWLHDRGPRSAEAFVDLDCAGLSRELLDSELFGHERGSFTGAVAAKPGLFEVAHRGTLFLDEVGNADLHVQAKLLKVLEERRFRRIGDVRERQVDVRLLTATGGELAELVRQGRFREDLLYRINAVTLRVPSLRERGDDVVLMARRMLEQLGAEVGFPGVRLSPAAERALTGHRWPGNIRELRNRLERALLLGDRQELHPADLGEPFAGQPGPARAANLTLREAEKLHIAAVLREAGMDVRRAAVLLGMSRSALYLRIKKHGIPLAEGS